MNSLVPPAAAEAAGADGAPNGDGAGAAAWPNGVVLAGGDPKGVVGAAAAGWPNGDGAAADLKGVFAAPSPPPPGALPNGDGDGAALDEAPKGVVAGALLAGGPKGDGAGALAAAPNGDGDVAGAEDSDVSDGLAVELIVLPPNTEPSLVPKGVLGGGGLDGLCISVDKGFGTLYLFANFSNMTVSRPLYLTRSLSTSPRWEGLCV